MLNLRLVLGLTLAFSLACAVGKDATPDDELDTEADADTDADSDSDTDADSDSDTDTDVPFAIPNRGFGGECVGDTCVYRVMTTAPAGHVELTMTETGDDFLYTEVHDRFEDEGQNGDDLYVYTLELTVTDDFEEQRANVSTLLAPEFHDGVTWFFYAESERGGDSDCVVTGHDPAYFSDACNRSE